MDPQETVLVLALVDGDFLSGPFYEYLGETEIIVAAYSLVRAKKDIFIRTLSEDYSFKNDFIEYLHSSENMNKTAEDLKSKINNIEGGDLNGLEKFKEMDNRIKEN